MSINKPQIRFPDFSQALQSCKLEEVCTKIGDGLHGTPKYVEGTGIYFINGNNLKNGKIEVTPATKEVSIRESKKNYKALDSNSILISINGTIGSIARYLNENIMLGKSVGYFNFSGHSQYFFHLLQSSKVQRHFKSQLTGTTIKNLSLKTLRETQIHIPTLAEQQKIASFLTAVDTKIELLRIKKEKLEQYKKGVMQKIFNQEIRFKDENGNDYPDWEEKKLGEVSNYFDGTHQTPKYVKKGIPFYSVEHVSANQFVKTKYISEEVFSKESKRVVLEKGDILMTRIGSIGKSKYIDWEVTASFYVSLALIKVHELLNAKFLNQFIKSRFFQRQLWKRTIHVAFPQKINLGEIGNCLVLCPCPEEQIKIAQYLTSLDQKLELVSTLIEKTETFKKGLLQKMFV